MPSAAAMARSSGVVTNPRTSSASAPTYTVRTVIVALSIFGYWRTVTPRIACSPAMRMTRFTTIASTGLLTKMSVNLIARLSPIRRVRRELGSRLDLVVHDDGHSVSQLERAARDHLLPRRDALGDRDEVAAQPPDADELLAGLAIRHHEDRIAVRRVDDRRRRNGH